VVTSANRELLVSSSAKNNETSAAVWLTPTDF